MSVCITEFEYFGSVKRDSYIEWQVNVLGKVSWKITIGLCHSIHCCFSPTFPIRREHLKLGVKIRLRKHRTIFIIYYPIYLYGESEPTLSYYYWNGITWPIKILSRGAWDFETHTQSPSLFIDWSFSKLGWSSMDLPNKKRGKSSQYGLLYCHRLTSVDCRLHVYIMYA